jgi:hypothetical protein
VAFLRFIIHAVGHPVNSAESLPHSSVDVPTNVDQFEDESFNAFLRRPADTNILAENQRRVYVEPFALPSQTEADSLLRWYFTTVNLMIPCIHEDSFRDTYTKTYSVGLRGLRRSWLALLNMVFAIATNIAAATSPTHGRAARSNTYFERAIELVRSDMLGRLSLEMGMILPSKPCLHLV